MTQKIKVIIPAYNEEDSIAKVINDIPTIVDEIIVISNNSTDKTEENAANAGATVLKESKRGYGYACLQGMNYISSLQLDEQPSIIVFLDGDYSDYPEQLTQLVAPILNDKIDFVIGSRVKKYREAGSMTPQQIFGNWLATFLMTLLFKAKFTDLGPFRAIRYTSLMSIGMQDVDFGWTVEMQVKAVKNRLRIQEIPVKYRERIGVSKITGTVEGTFKAGTKIIYTIFKYLLT